MSIDVNIIESMIESKSVDELISLSGKLFKLEYPFSICEIIVERFPEHLLMVLKLETNIPSKYDLSIIESINNNLKSTLVSYHQKTIDIEILSIYKNRKQ